MHPFHLQLSGWYFLMRSCRLGQDSGEEMRQVLRCRPTENKILLQQGELLSGHALATFWKGGCCCWWMMTALQFNPMLPECLWECENKWLLPDRLPVHKNNISTWLCLNCVLCTWRHSILFLLELRLLAKYPKCKYFFMQDSSPKHHNIWHAIPNRFQVQPVSSVIHEKLFIFNRFLC